MIVADRVIHATNVSLAWADAAAALLDIGPPFRAVNLSIRIADPRAEDEALRSWAENLAERLELQDPAEVANTIFPAEWAEDLPDPEQLGVDYRAHYQLLKSLGSQQGTYFGRLVAFPAAADGETIDQLTATASKLRERKSSGRLYKSVYELNIYDVARDARKTRGFPCLAHLGLHVGSDKRLNASALYRSHDVLAKGYGNYLGLGGLLAYIAQAAELECGELQVTAGGAFLEPTRVKQLVARREELEERRRAAEASEGEAPSVADRRAPAADLRT